MPIDYEHIMSLRSRGERVSYVEKDVSTYALAVGLGRDPLDAGELPYVYEGRGLKTLPTFASVLTVSRLLDDCGWDAARVEHGDEYLILHRPLDEAGSLLLDCDVVGVFDRGAGSGAAIVVETRARRERDGQPLFTLRRTMLARGDGGFGGPRGSPAPLPGMAEGPRFPARAPDMTDVITTQPGQALLFRLCGGREALHADPDIARQAGFPAPPLQPLCCAGIVCHSLLRVICEYDHTLITAWEAQFAGPAFPGETLVTELWQDANVVSFRLRARERDALVIEQGRCVLAT